MRYIRQIKKNSPKLEDYLSPETFGAILIMGGNGTRMIEDAFKNISEEQKNIIARVFGSTELPNSVVKGLLHLVKDETCLTNILESIPRESFVGIYTNQMPEFSDYIQNIPRQIHILKQQNSKITYPDGSTIKIPNGGGSFQKPLNDIVDKYHYPLEYIITYDGGKPWLHTSDVLKCKNKMGKAPIVTAVRDLTDAEIEKEKRAWDIQQLGGNSYPRFDRLYENEAFRNQRLPKEILLSKKAKALIGMTMMHYPTFANQDIIPTEVNNNGTYNEVTIVEILNSYKKVESFTPDFYLKSTKKSEDLNSFLKDPEKWIMRKMEEKK